MKKITKQEVKHIADLSRLKFTDEEIEVYTEQLGNILSYMDKLNEVDTTKVDTVTNIIFSFKEKVNIQPQYREDVPKNSQSQEDILDNAPSKMNKFFKVEKVIE